jgi:hypothetical protein
MSRYYFRVVPDDNGWQARRGSRVLGHYTAMDDAITRARVEAALHQPSEVIVHLPDGDRVTDSTFGWINPDLA